LAKAGYIARRANVIQAAEIEYDEAGFVTTGDATVVESKGEDNLADRTNSS
jgi:hypothetical protein